MIRNYIATICLVILLSAPIVRADGIEFDTIETTFTFSEKGYEKRIFTLKNVQGEVSRNDRIRFTITTNSTEFLVYVYLNESRPVYENYSENPTYDVGSNYANYWNITWNATFTVNFEDRDLSPELDPFKFIVAIYYEREMPIFINMKIAKGKYEITLDSPFLESMFPIVILVCMVLVIRNYRRKMLGN